MLTKLEHRTITHQNVDNLVLFLNIIITIMFGGLPVELEQFPRNDRIKIEYMYLSERPDLTQQLVVPLV